MSGLTAWHSPLPDAKPRLELYVWSLIEDARRAECARSCRWADVGRLPMRLALLASRVTSIMRSSNAVPPAARSGDSANRPERMRLCVAARSGDGVMLEAVRHRSVQSAPAQW